ncbi:MAG: nicotinate (nicotinamide) nucleotide adenylyltransferase [Oscillospiraceae bacterium]|jgi:nicotinate-nucleotide adenylyltransferase|nr:nicotinate (nicotinamide) nucleotide adenylyltransferase [Oscillospiraceae bacterium]
MKIGIFGGSFNPPHIGHVIGAVRAAEAVSLDRLLVVPAGVPPHKKLPENSPAADERFEMTRLAFAAVDFAEVSGIELRREGESYTADTIRELRAAFPRDELYLVMATDMFLTLRNWYDSEYILQNVTPVVTTRFLDRRVDELAAALEQNGTRCVIVRNAMIEISSSELRRSLRARRRAEFVDDCVYWYIIERKLYGAKPAFDALRRKAYNMLDAGRILHVAGCEEEAVSLAGRWGVSRDDAREAAILHDITKNLSLAQQLALCAEYGIVADELERESEKLLHSKTAAESALRRFAATDEVADAVRFHTTGRAGMSALEKVIYLADYIEPRRDFDGVAELRRLAYEDLDGALLRGLEMSVSDLLERGKTPHPNSLGAISSLKRSRAARTEEGIK